MRGKRFYIFFGCVLIIALLIGATFIGLPSDWAAYPSIALAGIAYYIIISSGGCHSQNNEKGGKQT